jgi:hypothetical protein
LKHVGAKNTNTKVQTVISCAFNKLVHFVGTIIVKLESMYEVTNYTENTESSNGLKTPSKYEFNTSRFHLHPQILSTDLTATA